VSKKKGEMSAHSPQVNGKSGKAIATATTVTIYYNHKFKSYEKNDNDWGPQPSCVKKALLVMELTFY